MMTKRTGAPAALVGLALVWAAAAQDTPPPAPKPEARQWAIGLSGRFKQLHDPVTAAYAIGSLATMVCAADQTSGAGLFQEALGRLALLTPQAFREPARVQPVASYTRLWKSLTAAAVKCDASLLQYADTSGAKAKMESERREANNTLRRAMPRVEQFPDRAMQQAQAALEAGDPVTLDIATLTRLLSELRDRATDLADDLFPQALEFVSSATAPDPALLMELGKYLFVAQKYFDNPDKEQLSEVTQVGQTSVVNFFESRKSTASDDVHDYIDAALKVITATNDPIYDPVAAYAIALQMLPKARDVAPDLVDQLQDALNQLAAQAGSSAARVQALVGAALPADAEALLVEQQIKRVFAAVSAKNFAEARRLAKAVTDTPARGQAGSLIDFADAADTISRRDLDWAASLTATLRPGVKRSLLYAAMSAASPTRETAFGYFELAFKDIEVLPAEQQMYTSAAVAAATLRSDPDTAFVALNQLVASANAAYTRPHQGRFDPQVLRRRFISAAGPRWARTVPWFCSASVACAR